MTLTDTTPTNRRDQLIETAMELFSEQGFATTSIKSIAQTAGVSQGLLYNYFSSKEELLRHIFRRGATQIEAAFASADGISELHLEDFINQLFVLINQEKKFWRLFHSVRMQGGIQSLLKQEISEIQFIIISRLQQLLAPYVPEESLTEALLLFATIDGVAGHMFLLDEYPTEAVIESIIQIYAPPED